MEKFPVISKNGKEYLVKIVHYDSILPYDKVIIYKKERFIKFEYNKRLYDKHFYWDNILYNDYKNMAIKTVELYEDSIKEKLVRENFKQNKFNEFIKWDGIIK